jgi:hypothetical protein
VHAFGALLDHFGPVKVDFDNNVVGVDMEDSFNICCLCALVLIVLIALLVEFLLWRFGSPASPWTDWTRVVTWGAAGGFLSIAIGVRKLDIDPDTQWRVNAYYGLIRLTIANISALVLYSLIKAGPVFQLIFSGTSDRELFALYAFATAAGFSETLVPNTLLSTEERVAFGPRMTSCSRTRLRDRSRVQVRPNEKKMQERIPHLMDLDQVRVGRFSDTSAIIRLSSLSQLASAPWRCSIWARR